MEPKLIRIDRNGTKYFEGPVKCDRCGGTGIYSHYHGVCWKCNGAGKVLGKWTEHTIEYENKLSCQRQKRQTKAEDARLAAREKALADLMENRDADIARLGFKNGRTYVVLGDTYPIRDTLKNYGAKYNHILGWHFADPTTEYQCLEILANDVLADDIMWYGDTPHYEFRTDADQIIQEKINAATCNTQSTYIGEVGKRITLPLTLMRIHTFDGFNGDTLYINKFTDPDGNVVVWKTTAWHGDEGKTYDITGTIKEHSEYRNEKQTVLTRCRVKED